MFFYFIFYLLFIFIMKSIKKIIKIQAIGGKATPAPPLGPVLGEAGINISAFISQFNEATLDKMGEKLPVEIIVYEDRSFDFKIKKPLASTLLRKAANIDKGSSEPNRKKVGRITEAKLRELAEEKIEDLNANTIENAMNILRGTAQSMGIEIVS